MNVIIPNDLSKFFGIKPSFFLNCQIRVMRKKRDH